MRAVLHANLGEHLGLSFNEIQRRAIEFSHEWAGESRERAEAKSFWDGFFNVFGLTRRRLASFEEPVKKYGDRQGFIDLFWRGTLIVEHKSRGQSLDRAYAQAIDYFPGIPESDLPQYILVSDFASFRLYDLDEDTTHDFSLADLHKNIRLFDFVLGYRKQKIVDEDPVNIKAAELMGRLHDALNASGYSGHQLEMFLVRIMFCMFADDTGIFAPKDHFTYYIENRTAADGSDVGPHLAQIFQVLNTPDEQRQRSLDEDLRVLPYVNGLLFAEPLPFPSFDSPMRALLLECCHFDWSSVSPAIFGSLFQSVMDPKKRRELGGHYTAERNIMKVVRSLFLDDLRSEVERAWSSERKLWELLKRIAGLKFFDPACGCGNFLVITYREIRLLELDIRVRLKALSKTPEQQVFLEAGKGIDVDAFFGVEIEEFPGRIAQVALWLVDHQMNIRLSKALGFYFTRLPLRKAPNITIANALRIDWNQIVAATEVSYVLGNPPYAGKKRRNPTQAEDMRLVLSGKVENHGVLDYVACWYVKASEYIKGTNVKVAFVSTNAITHGEQVSVLWKFLLEAGVRIHFAHRTFAWTSEARGKAGVHVVIIGFSLNEPEKTRLFDYPDPTKEPVEVAAKNINPYLVNEPTLLIPSRAAPICAVPEISFGSMPNDDGNFVFTTDQRDDFLRTDPDAAQFFRPLLSAEEFLHGEARWCLWLVGALPHELKKHPGVLARIKAVKQYRERSKRGTTQKLAAYPAQFGENRQPVKDYILIPRHSSETRRYIPMGLCSKNEIASDSCVFVPGGSFYHFGVLMSAMHMAWVRQVAGRLTGRLRYSNKIVYNNFPWPNEPSEVSVREIGRLAREILANRTKYAGASLADLYDPLLAPKELMRLHERLDKAVDKAYRAQPFSSELARIRFLFRLYRFYTKDKASPELESYTDSDDPMGIEEGS